MVPDRERIRWLQNWVYLQKQIQFAGNKKKENKSAVKIKQK